MGSLIKGLIGKEDANLQYNTNAAETFDRLGSTGGTTSLTKFPDIWGYSGAVRAGEIIAKGPWADVRAFGAKVDGASDDKTVFNLAIANGKAIYIPAGILDTTGGHIMNVAAGQQLIGSGEEQTTIKRLSGTSDILSLTGQNYQTVKGITFDGNSLGGIGLKIAGSYQKIDNIRIENVGGTSYAFTASGVNASSFRFLNFGDTNYGQMNLNNVLYSSFYDMLGGKTNGGYGLYIHNGSEMVSFHKMYTEGQILIDGAVSGNINNNFYGLFAELDLDTGTWFEVNSTSNMGININELRVFQAGTSTDPLFSVTCFGFKVNSFYFRRTGVSAGAIFSILGSTSQVEISDVIDYNDTAHTFCQDAATSIFIHLKNCWKHSSGQAGTNIWSGSHIIVENSNMKQTFTATADHITMINVAGEILTTNLVAGCAATFINCDSIKDSAGATFSSSANGTWIKTTTGDPAEVINGVIVINEYDDTIKIGKEGAWASLI